MIDMSDDKNLYTVGEVAERFSVTVRTLHHWEAQGAPCSCRTELVKLPALLGRGLCSGPKDHHLSSDGNEAGGH